jgi:RHS repeat-associated protein
MNCSHFAQPVRRFRPIAVGSRHAGRKKPCYRLRLITINYPGSGNNTKFTYDGLGQCVKIIETNSSVIASTKQFIYGDESERCEARDASAVILNQYYSFGETISNNNYIFTRDHLGSVREISDSAGITHGIYNYDPYGNPIIVQGNVTADLLYAGYYFHSRSGLCLTLRREFSSTLGRWLSRDPHTNDKIDNLYIFADGNPLINVDPFGTDAWVLTDPKGMFGLGLGHTAMVIGNDDMGYYFYSKSMIGFGGRRKKGLNGPPPGNGVDQRYTHYDYFHTCEDKDPAMKEAADKLLPTFYLPLFKSCVNFVLRVLAAGGRDINPGGARLPNPTAKSLDAVADDYGNY